MTSAHKSVGITNKVFDRCLMAYQPLLVGKLVGVLKALQARAESNRHAAAIHADGSTWKPIQLIPITEKEMRRMLLTIIWPEVEAQQSH